jgi:hypothetical protein
MNERVQRILQFVLLFFGIMMIYAAYSRLLPFNVASFISAGCFIAIAALHFTGLD